MESSLYVTHKFVTLAATKNNHTVLFKLFTETTDQQ